MKAKTLRDATITNDDAMNCPGIMRLNSGHNCHVGQKHIGIHYSRINYEKIKTAE